MPEEDLRDIVIGLSKAEHLSDESNKQLIYEGPRFSDDKWHIKIIS